MNQQLPGNSTLIGIAGWNHPGPDPALVNILGGQNSSEPVLRALLPLHERHQCPIVITSPVDAPIKSMGPHICVSDGKHGYANPEHLNRFYLSLVRLLSFDFAWYVIHESDSVCLSPEFPAEVYSGGDILWSNEAPDFRVDLPQHGADFHRPLPQIAMHCGLMMNRRVLRAIVGVWHSLPLCPVTPFGDWQLVQACHRLGIEHRPHRPADPEGFPCIQVLPGMKASRWSLWPHPIRDAGGLAKNLLPMDPEDHSTYPPIRFPTTLYTP